MDHDSVAMNNISAYKNGNFCYIENIEKASEYFVLSMSIIDFFYLFLISEPKMKLLIIIYYI